MHSCQMQAEQTLEDSSERARNRYSDTPLKTTNTEKVSTAIELSPQHLAAMTSLLMHTWPEGSYTLKAYQAV